MKLFNNRGFWIIGFFCCIGNTIIYLFNGNIHAMVGWGVAAILFPRDKLIKKVVK